MAVVAGYFCKEIPIPVPTWRKLPPIAVTASLYGVATTGEPASGIVGGDQEEGFF